MTLRSRLREWLLDPVDLELLKIVTRVEYSDADFIVAHVGVQGVREERIPSFLDDVQDRLRKLLKHENVMILPQYDNRSMMLSVLAKAELAAHEIK